MMLDVDAVFMIGWFVDHNKAVNYSELSRNGFEKLEKIPGVDARSEWVMSTNEYAHKSKMAIGWQPLMWVLDEEGRFPVREMSVDEFANSLNNESKIEAAKQVYEAVMGHPPETEPTPILFERWW